MALRMGIQSTAGAVPVRTEKGLKMEKVKVTRYIAGKVPEYAQRPSSTSGSSEESESEDDKKRSSKGFRQVNRNDKDDYDRREKSRSSAPQIDPREALVDPRMRRLLQKSRDREDSSDEDVPARRHIAVPEIVESRVVAVKKEKEQNDYDLGRSSPVAERRYAESSDDADEDELPEDEMLNRRALLRMKIATKDKEELMAKDEESNEDEEYDEEETEYEESDSEDDDINRLKPVFVKKKDRVTLADNEKEQQKQREKELRKKYEAEERKRQSTKIVEDIVKQELEMERKKQDDDNTDLTSVLTDDENEELAYEAWKVRELKRIKRTKEEKEQHEKEKAELDKIHSMTEDERRAFLRANPRTITNKQQKGKYKFLQKYYHRGVFYLDHDDEVYKRNFSEATLEDHFDKSVLPKIMQVKDFGKAGRTKWTHLVSEDTTDFQSAWHADTAQNIKFFQKHGAATKDVFERPALKKRKKN